MIQAAVVASSGLLYLSSISKSVAFGGRGDSGLGFGQQRSTKENIDLNVTMIETSFFARFRLSLGISQTLVPHLSSCEAAKDDLSFQRLGMAGRHVAMYRVYRQVMGCYEALPMSKISAHFPPLPFAVAECELCDVPYDGKISAHAQHISEAIPEHGDEAGPVRRAVSPSPL